MSTPPRQFERKIVTILFADVVGYTPLAEKLDPEDLVIVQEAYFGAVRATVERYRGKIEKYIGDAVMATFGVPRAEDDDAERAVRAALAIHGAVESAAGLLDLGPDTELKVRVGVNTGVVVVRPEGTASEASVTGDDVNVAARLQTVAPPGGVFIGEATALAVGNAFELEDVGHVDLKGKSTRLRAFKVLGLHDEPSRDRALGELRAPMIGRDSEMQSLHRGLAEASSGTVRMVIAAPGVGKSRLVNEFAASLLADGVPVLKARCSTTHAHVFDPIAQLLRSALGSHPSEHLTETLTARLSRFISSPRMETVVDAVERLLSPIAADDLPVARNTEELFDAWRAALTKMVDSPAVWIVEDLHWAPDDLLTFIKDISESSAEVFVLATTRPAILDRRHPLIVKMPLTWRLDLTHLPEDHGSALVRALIGGALPENLVSTIAERSDGTPLFIEELLRAWVSTGVLKGGNGSWRLTAAPDEVPLPKTVQAIYLAQLDDLPVPAREAVRLGSVAGRVFPKEALSALGASSPDDGIEILLRRDFVSGPEPDEIMGSTYSFRHALLREAGYVSLAKAQRAELHLRMADWLEGLANYRAGDAAEPIASHLARALESIPEMAKDVGGRAREDISRLAATWYERAAESARVTGAVYHARDLLIDSLGFTPEEDLLDRSRRLRLLGERLHHIAHMIRAIEVHREAHDIARELFAASGGGSGPEREAFALSAASLIAALIDESRSEEASKVGEAALSELGAGDDPATAHLELSHARVRSGLTNDWSIAQEVAAKVLKVARDAEDVQLEIGALLPGHSSGNREEAIAATERAVELCKQIGDFTTAASTKGDLAWIFIPDEPEKAWKSLDEALEITEAYHLLEPSGWVGLYRCEMGLRTGSWDEALRSGLTGLDVAEVGDYFRLGFRIWLPLTAMAAARGDMDLLSRAADWFRDKEADFPSPPSPYGRITKEACLHRFAAAGLGHREPPSLEHLIPSFEMRSRPFGTTSTPACIETIFEVWLGARMLAELDRALALLEGNIDPNAEDNPGLDDPLYAISRSLAARFRAKTNLALGREGEDIDALVARSIDLARLARAPWWIAKAIASNQELGAASSEELQERADIEGLLGIPPHQSVFVA